MPHQIFIAARTRRLGGLIQEFGRIPMFDVTHLTRESRLLRLNPYFPHGAIPVAYSERTLTAQSLEAIWNGLKVFENEPADFGCFEKMTKISITRMPGKAGRGKLLGWQQGIHPDKPLLVETEARRTVYAGTYRWILKEYCREAIDFLRGQMERSDIVLLDYSSEHHRCDLRYPLMHSVLLRDYLLGRHPTLEDDWRPLTDEEYDHIYEERRAESAVRMLANQPKQSFSSE